MAPYPSFPLHLPRGLSDPNSPIARDPHGKTVKTWLGDVNSSSNSPTMRASSPTTPDALLSTSNFVILCSLGGKYILSVFLSRSQRSPPFSCTFVRPSTFLHPFPRKSSLKRGSALFASLRRLSHSALMMRAAKKSVQWRSLLPLIE